MLSRRWLSGGPHLNASSRLGDEALHRGREERAGKLLQLRLPPLRQAQHTFSSSEQPDELLQPNSSMARTCSTTEVSEGSA